MWCACEKDGQVTNCRHLEVRIQVQNSTMVYCISNMKESVSKIFN